MVVTSKDRNIYIEISKKEETIFGIYCIVSQFQWGKKRNSDWEHIFEVTAEWKIFWDNRVSKDPVCLKAMVSQKVLAVLFCPLVYLSVCCSVCLLKKSFLSVSPLQAGSSQVPHPTCSWKIHVSWGTRLAGSCFVLLSYRFVVLLFRTFLSVLKSRDGSCWTLVVTSHYGNRSVSWPNAQKNKILKFHEIKRYFNCRLTLE